LFGDKLLPIFRNVSGWLRERIPQAIGAVSGFFRNKLIPAVKTAFGWVRDNVFPIVRRLAQWLRERIPQAIGAVSGFFRNKLIPAVKTAFGWVRDNVFPIARRLAQWLRDKVVGAGNKLATFFREKLLPAIRDAWGWVEENVFPIARDLRDWLAEKIPAAIKTLRDWWNKLRIRMRIFVGKARAYLSYFANQAEYHLGRAVDWIKVKVPEAFDAAKEAASDFASGFKSSTEGELKPALEGTWKILRRDLGELWQALKDLAEALGLVDGEMGKVNPDFEFAGQVLGDVLVTGIKLAAITLHNLLDVLTWMTDKITEAIEIAKALGSQLKVMFDHPRETLKALNDLLAEFLNGLADAVIPDWLKPGSPTPFETGLRGIADALRKMPEFKLGVETPDLGALQPALAGGGEAPSLAGAGGERTTVQFYGPVTVEGVQDGEGLLNDLTEMARG
jgi:hypothetical protein